MLQQQSSQEVAQQNRQDSSLEKQTGIEAHTPVRLRTKPSLKAQG